MSDPALLRAAVEHLRAADPVMAAIVDRIGPCGLSVDASQTPVEALAESMCYQQITGRAAATIHGRLLKLVRGRVTPARLRALSDEQMRAAGLSRQKIASLRDLAEKADRRMTLRALSAMDDEQVIEALTRVRGVGRWTAEMFLVFRLGRPDVLPVGDYGIRKAMQKAWRMRALPNPDRMRKLAARWRPYRTVACWYLWRSLDGAAGRAQPAPEVEAPKGLRAMAG